MRKVKLLGVVLGLVLCATAFAAAPPATPGNSCEARCLADFRQCEATCSKVLCLVPCDLLFNACVANNCTAG